MIKAAVIGVGSLGQHHARILASTPGVSLVGIADIDPDQGRAVAERHGTRFFQDYRELVSLIDCVTVAAPTTDHHRICVPFLDAGRHVLVEKPIAADSADARDLIRRAAHAGVVLQVGHLERFNPALLAVRGLARDPRFFEAHRLGVFVPRCLDVDVVLDLMIHDLDLVLHLIQSEIRDIRASGAPVLTGKIDIASARIEFANGAVANLTASRISAEKLRKFRWFQEGQYFSVDLGRQAVVSRRVQSADNPVGREMVAQEISVQAGEPLRLELESFIQTVRGEGPNGCRGEEGLAALEAAHAVLARIAAGH